MKKGWVKFICAALCALTLTAGLLGGVMLLALGAYDGDDFYSSTFFWGVTTDNRGLADEGFELTRESLLRTLTGYEKNRLAEISQALDPANSNFRFCYSGKDGDVIFSNTGGDPDWFEGVHTVYSAPYPLYYGDGQYVYRHEAQSGYQQVNVVLEYGVTTPLSAQDAYRTAQAQFDRIQSIGPGILAVCAGCLIAGLVLLVLLVRFAGRRPGRDGLVLNLLDRVPYEIFLAAAILLFAIGVNVWFETFYYIPHGRYTWEIPAIFLACLGCVAILLAFVLTTATRIKARTLFRNTLIWRLCRLIRRLCLAAVRALRTLPMTWRAVGLFLLYLLGTLLTGMTVLLIPFYQGFVLWLICRWVLQWQRVRKATRAIVAGQTDVKIDHAKFYPDLRQHAAQLNDLGSAIDHAVEERLKSERFKAELITNVSHDLKTPLTSIINYVDLLKKEDVANPTAREYIEVLDRKSQRLKKLTEDLVEASKASTGALTVNRERLDMGQLSEQAAGEYEERLTAAGLTLVKTLPEEPVWIEADGRHLWRVLDNLLGNCAKYALAGTRVYLDLSAWDGNMVLSVKNISAQPLNIPPEQLMERFVRGDESRTEEGSGLGLSIARSLTELQGGRFSLNIDGDLFKAVVVFPLAQ